MRLFKKLFKLYMPAIFGWLILMAVNIVLLLAALATRGSFKWDFVEWWFESLVKLILGPLTYLGRLAPIPLKLPEAYYTLLFVIKDGLLLLIFCVIAYSLYLQFRKIKTTKNKPLFLIIVIFSLLLYFPKPNGSVEYAAYYYDTGDTGDRREYKLTGMWLYRL